MSAPLVMAGSVVSGDLKDGPALFLCSCCRLPLGDSGDWTGKGEDDGDIILLKGEGSKDAARAQGFVMGWSCQPWMAPTLITVPANIYHRSSYRPSVTENVEIDKTKAVSSYTQDFYSTVQVLFCKGCGTSIGALYIATPEHLDYKQDKFILNTSSVSCYDFTHARKQRTSQKSANLPTVSYMDAQLKKCKTVFGYCERAVTEMEERLFPSSEGP